MTAPPKAAYGSPCNGCGMCCAAEVCAIGKLAFPEAEAPCPAMVFEDNRFYCGIVLAEQAAGLAPAVYEALGIGKGCCADDPRI